MRYPLKGTQQEDDMASYNVSYNYTVEQADLDALVDIAMLGRANKRGMLIVRVVFAVLGGALVGLLGRAAQRGDTSWIVAALALALVVYLIGPGTEKIWHMRVKSRLGDDAKNLIGKHIRYVFSPAGIQITSNKSKGSVPWSDFAAWGTHDHYLYLERTSGSYLVVDMARLNKTNASALRALLGSTKLTHVE